MIRSALDEVSAWASVLATMKSTPTSPDTIMLLTALPPAPPTPQTMIRGFSSRSSGAFKLIVILGLLTLRRPPAPGLDCDSFSTLFSGLCALHLSEPVEALLEPAPEAGGVAAVVNAGAKNAPARLEML